MLDEQEYEITKICRADAAINCQEDSAINSNTRVVDIGRSVWGYCVFKSQDASKRSAQKSDFFFSYASPDLVRLFAVQI